MQHGAGVSLNRSSTSQSKQGTAISADQMQPGDLIFYGSGRGINHVAMYIGDGKWYMLQLKEPASRLPHGTTAHRLRL